MDQAKLIEIDGHRDLPLQCPNKKYPAWSAHPRVLLDCLSTGHVKCPYCGNEYRLKPGTAPSGH